MADIITPQKNYATGIRLVIFDMVTFTVDAVPQSRPNSSKDSAMRRVAVVNGAPEPVSQRYVTADGTAFAEHELGRAREIGDGTLVLLDADTVTAAKVGDLEANEFTVSIHPVDQVERACRPAGGGYRLRAPRKATAKERELYATIRAAIAAAPDKAFVGSLRLRSSRAFYRLVVWNDQLLLQELTHPADLAEVDVIDVAPDEALANMATTLVASSTTDFDPDACYHDVAAAFDKAIGQVPATAKASTPTLTVVSDPAAAMFELALAAKTDAA